METAVLLALHQPGKALIRERIVVRLRSIRSAVTVLLLLTALIGSGCQMWQVEPSVWLDENTTKNVEAVRVVLNSDSWHVNRKWTPEGEWKTRRGALPAPSEMRWLFALVKENPKDEPSAPVSSPKFLKMRADGPTAVPTKSAIKERSGPQTTQNVQSIDPRSQVIRAQSPGESSVANQGTQTDRPPISTVGGQPSTKGATQVPPASTSAHAADKHAEKNASSPIPAIATDSNSTTARPTADEEHAEHPDDPRHEERQETVTGTWDGFWPLGIEQLIAATATEGGNTGIATEGEKRAAYLRCLSTLACSDNLVGWNATILWARHHPADAVAAAPILERLVTDPPDYDPRTGKHVFPNARPNDETPAGSQSSSATLSRDAVADAGATAVKTWQKLTGVDQAEAQMAEHTPSRQISEAMRLAAAEAWCLVLAHDESDPTEGLAPIGRLLERVDLPVNVRGELFRGVARWIAPVDIPRLENALREVYEDEDQKERVMVAIRRAAIESCLIHALWSSSRTATGESAESSVAEGSSTENSAKEKTAESETAVSSESQRSASEAPLPFNPEDWPETSRSCRNDPDPLIRWTYGKWLARVRAPDALEVLKSQLHDVDLRVRDEAAASLAVLHTDEARNELRSYSERSRDRLRATALGGLSSWGLQELNPYVRDESYIVRNVVAAEIGRKPSVESAVLLQELLVDASTEVQQSAVDAVKNWDDTLAIPLLLHGMRDSSAKTRQECYRALTKRRKIATPYRFDGSRDERAKAVQEIVQKENLPASYVAKIARSGLQTAAKVDALHVKEVQSLLQELEASTPQSPESQSVLERLKKLSTVDVPLLEESLAHGSNGTTTIVAREVLPQISPAHAALLDLESPDVSIRRRGASALSQLGQTASLSPLVLRRLREALVQEQDRWVWRAALNAVAADATDETGEIALLAVNHAWPDIRELGCEYVSHHGQPRMALWLLPLLDDSSKTVQLAAIRALGKCHNPIALDGLPSEPASPGRRRGLRELLGHPDKPLQFAAMVSMSQLGDPQGMQELMRMSYHQSAQIREEAVRQMGDTGQTLFVGHLINLAWTESHDTVRRSILDSLDRLVPSDKRPQGLDQAVGHDAKIRLWASWWQA